MKTTTSVHWNKGQVAQAHNLREENLCSRESHIDLFNEHGQSFHEIIFHRELLDVYDDVFGDALAEFNVKQKRKDRQMTMEDYIKSVEKDTRGKKQTKIKNGKKIVDEDAARQGKQISYEITVRVGNCYKKKDENGRVIYDACNHHIHEEELPRDLQCSILQRYSSTFQTENPNFAIVNINRHGDEGFFNRRNEWEYGEIHDHIEFVPYASGYKQGLAVQNSMGRAMKTMGFDDSNCYEMWAKKEQERLNLITKEEYEKYCNKNPDFAKTHGELTLYNPVSDKKKAGNKTKEQLAAEEELDEYIHEAEYLKREYEEKSKKIEDEIVSLRAARGEFLRRSFELDEKIKKVDELIQTGKDFRMRGMQYYNTEQEWMGKQAGIHIREKLKQQQDELAVAERLEEEIRQMQNEGGDAKTIENQIMMKWGESEEDLLAHDFGYSKLGI